MKHGIIVSMPWQPLADGYAWRGSSYGQVVQDELRDFVEPPTATGDELREAKNPTTPGERLTELFDVRWRESHLPHRLARNPALPWPQLRQLLTGQMLEALYGVSLTLAAWHNPALPWHLMAAPDPELQEAAARVLWSRTSEVLPARHFQGRLPRVEPLGLPALVGVLGRLERDAPGLRGSRRARELLDLARHLAGLFGLTWPADPG